MLAKEVAVQLGELDSQGVRRTRRSRRLADHLVFGAPEVSFQLFPSVGAVSDGAVHIPPV